MRKISIAALSLGALIASPLLGAAAAAAASDLYLKIKGPAGESAKAGQEKQIDLLSFSWGATQPVAAINLNSSKSNAYREAAVSDPGASDRINLNSSKSNVKLVVSDPGAQGPKKPQGIKREAPPASGMPLPQGSVLVKFNAAWPECVIGTRYSEAELGTPSGRYVLEDVTIASCDRESLSFDYSKLRESPAR